MASASVNVRSETLATSGFFVLRTPLLPFDEFARWGDLLVARHVHDLGVASTSKEDAWRNDVEMLRTRLRKLIDLPGIRQALFLASPPLESSINQWEREPDSKKGLQTERALVRYFARMTGRTTPFGLFAGCSVGTVPDEFAASDACDLVLQSRDNYKVSSRLDYEYLCALSSSLECLPQVAAELHYWPASSLHKTGEFWHYVEPRFVGAHRSDHLVRLENDKYLDAIIERARRGAALQQLLDALLHLTDCSVISKEQAMSYVQELANARVLVSSISPLVTGKLALDDLIDQLGSLRSGIPISKRLQKTRISLAALDRGGLGVPRADYEEIAVSLGDLPAKINLSSLFQIDLIKPFERGVLCRPVIDELVRGVDFLCGVGAFPPGEPDKVRVFREDFSSRYGTSWVPLLEALDEEIGIGFGRLANNFEAALLAGLPLASRQSRIAEPMSDFHSALLRKVVDCCTREAKELTLEVSDFTVSNAVERLLPTSFSIAATIAAESMVAVREGNFRLCLHSQIGPSGGILLGRFCHADPQLTGHVRNHFRQEEENDPDAVYAEIVYLPEGRGGNIVCRPILRGYEIACLGRSGAPADKQLPLSDLLVTVAGNRILLHSQRLGKRVIARLAAAHGFNGPSCPAAYQFLGYLQYEPGTNPPMFDWGPLEDLPFLPRVSVGRVILARARWRISPEETRELTKSGRCECFFAVQRLREHRNIPRWVLFIEKGNTLVVDLDNPLSVDAFIHVSKRSSKITLLELYPTPDELCVVGPEGRYQHELIVPFVRRVPKSPSMAAVPPEPTPRGRVNLSLIAGSKLRTFPPGSQWLYLKIYGGAATLDEILATVLPSLVDTALSRDLIYSWFFIRYSQPHRHLRVRFHGEPNKLTQTLLPLIYDATNALFAKRKLWKVELDTYEREIERYGGVEGTLNSEQIFSADSEAVLTILHALTIDVGSDLRLRIAIAGVDRLFSDCGFDLSERQAAVQRSCEFMEREFRLDAAVRKRLSQRFRVERASLENLLDESNTGLPSSTSMNVIRQAFEVRSNRVTLIVQKLRFLDQTGQLSRSIFDMALSYAHMHVNRLMRSTPRAHELLLHDSLARIYSSRLAKEGGSRGTIPPTTRTAFTDESEMNGEQ